MCHYRETVVFLVFSIMVLKSWTEDESSWWGTSRLHVLARWLQAGRRMNASLTESEGLFVYIPEPHGEIWCSAGSAGSAGSQSETWLKWSWGDWMQCSQLIGPRWAQLPPAEEQNCVTVREQSPASRRDLPLSLLLLTVYLLDSFLCWQSAPDRRHRIPQSWSLPRRSVHPPPSIYPDSNRVWAAVCHRVSAGPGNAVRVNPLWSCLAGWRIVFGSEGLWLTRPSNSLWI